MADQKITQLTEDTSPTSDDLLILVDDAGGTPANKKSTNANVITKAHGLSDGIVKVASGVMTPATGGTDYANASHTHAKADVTDLNAYEVGGTDVAVTDGGTGASNASGARTNLGLDPLATYKSKTDATTAPGSTNDNTEGYSVGSIWIDVTNDKSYIAVDVSTGAAVWNDLTASAGGGISNVVEDTTPQLGGDLDMNGNNITAAGPTTISPTEMSYLDGVTSAIQTQIDGKQPLDSDLTTIAGLTATTDNFIQSKSSAWASRTPTQVTADLIAFTGDSGSGGVKGLVPAPSAGDAAASKYLKADGTWATAGGGGGQTYYTHLIASSGGDYTTVSAYFADAPVAGDVLLIRGTVTETTGTTVTTNGITIMGENTQTSIWAFGTGNIILSGTDITIKNLQITISTGYIRTSANGAIIKDCYINASGNPASNGQIRINGTNSKLLNCNYYNSASSGASLPFVQMTGANAQVLGCDFYAYASSSDTNDGILSCSGSYALVVGNTFRGAGTSAAYGVICGMTGLAANFSGNTVSAFNAGTSQPAFVYLGVSGGVIGNNTFYQAGVSVKSGSVVGNHIEFTTGTSSYPIQIDGDEVIIANNVIKGVNSSGSVAVLVIGNCDYTQIHSNFIEGFPTGVYAYTAGNDVLSIKNNTFMTITTPLNIANIVDYEASGNNGTSEVDERKIVWMKNTSGGSLAAGDLVVLKSVAAGNEVTTTTTAGDNKIYGMAVETITNNSLGQILTIGKTTDMKVNGTTAIAVGDFISAYSSAGIGQKAASGHMAIAVALEAYSTADSAGVIDAMLITPRKI